MKGFAMDILYLLSIIQGVTEFLPISSTAHMMILGYFYQIDEQTLANISIFLHLGSLMALVVYFYRDVMTMAKGGLFLLRGRLNGASEFTLKMIITTLPAIIVGFLIVKTMGHAPQTPIIIGINSIIFGLILFLLDRFPQNPQRHLTYKGALIMGVSQALALIPGVSRMGITLSAGRLLQFDRSSVIHLSFLMAIPTILGAVVLKAPDMIYTPLPLFDILISIFLSFGVGILTIHLLLKMVASLSFSIFAIYRILLGIGILWLMG